MIVKFNKGNYFNKLMEKKIIFILPLFLLLLLSFSTAEDDGSVLIGKQGNCINLPQECTNCSYINLTTITLPNMTTLLFNVPMNQTINSYNYTFCNTHLLGNYGYCMVGDVDGVATSVCKPFIVTTNGLLQTTSQGIGSAVFLFLILALTILFGWMGFKLSESKTLWIVGIFFLFLSVLFVVYDVWLGYEYHKNFTGLSNSGMPETIFYIFLFLLVVGLLSSLALLFTRWKYLARYIKKEIKSKNGDDEFEGDFKE